MFCLSKQCHAAFLTPPIPWSAASSPKLPCLPLLPLFLHILCKNVGYLGYGFSGKLFASLIFLGTHKLSQVQVIVLKYCAVTLQRRLPYIMVFLEMTYFLLKKNFGQGIFEDFIHFSKYWRAEEPRQSSFCSLRNPTHSQHEVIAVIFPTNFSL